MKTALLLLFLLCSFGAGAQVWESRWAIGYSSDQVKSRTLSEPGRRLMKDSGYSKSGLWRFTLYVSNDTTEFIQYEFFNEKCEEYKISLEGVHKQDLDERYSDLENTGPNDWIDRKSSGLIYIHREYNGYFTELTISLRKPK